MGYTVERRLEERLAELQRLQRKHGLSRPALAEMLGVNLSTVTRYFGKKIEVPIQALRYLALAKRDTLHLPGELNSLYIEGAENTLSKEEADLISEIRKLRGDIQPRAIKAIIELAACFTGTNRKTQTANPETIAAQNPADASAALAFLRRAVAENQLRQSTEAQEGTPSAATPEPHGAAQNQASIESVKAVGRRKK